MNPCRRLGRAALLATLLVAGAARAQPAPAGEGVAAHGCQAPGDVASATTPAQLAEHRKRLQEFKACIDRFVALQEASIQRAEAAIKAAVEEYNAAALAYNASLQKPKDK